jgi:hypothetical protein
MEDREYQEFLQWLEFKRQRTQQTTVVVNCEQPQLLLDQEPSLPKYEMQKHFRNFQKPYTMHENCAIRDLLAAGWAYSEIGELLGRSGKAIKGQFHNHIKGKL